MDNLTKFNTEEEFELLKNNLPKPWVAWIKDKNTLFYKELKKQFIKATIDTTSLYNSDGSFKDPNNKKLFLCLDNNFMENIKIHAQNTDLISDKIIYRKKLESKTINNTISEHEIKKYIISDIFNPNEGIKDSNFLNILNKSKIGGVFNNKLYIPNDYETILETLNKLDVSDILKKGILCMYMPSELTGGSSQINLLSLFDVINGDTSIINLLFTQNKESVKIKFNPEAILGGFGGEILWLLKSNATIGIFFCENIEEIHNPNEMPEITSLTPYKQNMNINMYLEYSQQFFECDILENNPINYNIIYNIDRELNASDFRLLFYNTNLNYKCLINTIDFSKVDTTNIIDMWAMLGGCLNLISIEFCNGFKSECRCDDMFYGINTDGTLYLNTRTLLNGNTWEPILKVLPGSWNVIYRDEL